MEAQPNSPSEIYIHKFVKKDCEEKTDVVQQKFLMQYFVKETAVFDDIEKYEYGRKSILLNQIMPNDDNNRTRVWNLYRKHGIVLAIKKDVKNCNEISIY